MKPILITNDDGIAAEGLLRLARAAKEFGDVWVIAPRQQRSAVSHSITLRHSLDIFPVSFPVEGVSAYSCTGTPADCVRVGIYSVMPEKPDVVLSGINYGFNVASDIQYSATAGAAFEASFQGCTGIALSEQACSCHEVTDAHLIGILKMLIGRSPGPGCIWNVNFPGCSLSEFRGILEDRKVSAGSLYRDRYKLIEKLDGDGIRVIVDGIYNENAEEGTDFCAVVKKYISIGRVRNII